MHKVKNIDEMPKKSPLSLQIDLKKFEKATEEEKKQQDVMSESVSFFRDGMRKLMRNPLAVGSIIVLLLIVAMILIVPHVRNRPISQKAERYSLILWVLMKWAVTTLYVLFMVPGFH